jgi:hypothetical protein
MTDDTIKLLKEFQKPKLPKSVRDILARPALELDPELSLTDQQEKFASLVAMGNTLIESFKQSYAWEGYKKGNIYNKAYSLIKHPKIAARVDQILREREGANVHEGARLRAFVIERLQRESLNEKNPGSSRVRALELLGRMDMVRLFEETPEKDAKQQHAGDVLKDIETRLTKILSAKGILDVTPEEVVDTPKESGDNS